RERRGVVRARLGHAAGRRVGQRSRGRGVRPLEPVGRLGPGAVLLGRHDTRRGDRSRLMDVVDVIIIAGKAIFVFALLLILTLFVIWAERKILAHMQSRIGPNRAGPFGILQSIADGVKLFMKEDIRPVTADKFVYP